MRDSSKTNPTQSLKAERSPVSRRALLAATTAFAGGALAPDSAKAAKKPAEQSAASGIIIASDTKAVAETTAGKVRGYVRDGIYTYKGLPYAQSTAGKGRFMP